jgi:DNA polymerase IV
MRSILHADMDAFFASVEQYDHPSLRGKPVIVGAAPDARGVVAACSYEARKFGVHSAMPSREAYRCCPQGVFVPPRMKRYGDVSRQIFAIFERFTPLVEPLSVDEAFLDVSGATRMFGKPAEIARRIKQTVRDETGLNVSIGIAHNKFLAKVASDLSKPDGLLEMPEGREAVAAFLAPLPATRIWGVGEVTARHLTAAGLHTIGDLQRVTVEQLASVVGAHSAEHMLRLAWGEDAREVELDTLEKSISREYTFPQDVKSRPLVEATLLELVDDVGQQLREAGRYAGLARLKLRWQGFKTITRQKSLPHPCCDDFTLREAARALFDVEPLIKPVRLIGFGVSHLNTESREQLELFASAPPEVRKRERLSHTVDRIRKKFGSDSIRRPRDDDHTPQD